MKWLLPLPALLTWPCRIFITVAPFQYFVAAVGGWQFRQFGQRYHCCHCCQAMAGYPRGRHPTCAAWCRMRAANMRGVTGSLIAGACLHMCTCAFTMLGWAGVGWGWAALGWANYVRYTERAAPCMHRCATYWFMHLACCIIEQMLRCTEAGGCLAGWMPRSRCGANQPHHRRLLTGCRLTA
jgi:hypothetical protein